MSAVTVNWRTCSEDGCFGVRLGRGGKCLAHVAPERVEAALTSIGRDGDVDARGVEISSELLSQILDALPRSPSGGPKFQKADFREATFKGDADFAGTTFAGNAQFDGANFTDGADFTKATFTGYAWFYRATFAGEARFLEGATFGKDAMFSWAIFTGPAWFLGATFTELGDFTGATFTGYAWFDGATFTADAQFATAAFMADARFDGTTFTAGAWFGGVTCTGNAMFEGATFTRARKFGPVLVHGWLSLKDAIFPQAVELFVSANRVRLAGARFPSGARIAARWADIVMDDADFAQPSILIGAPRFEWRFGFKERKLVKRLRQDGVRSMRRGKPRVVGLRRANVANLVLSNVDLRPCRFVGAHNLDRLRIDARSTFPPAPAGLRTTRRRTIAEEHDWRARRPKRWWRSTGWYPPVCEFPQSFGHAEPCEPDDIAAIYRELRKGREDSKNEPGAADFYYGEMEMRRFDETKPRAEHVILWLYWLVSGYGLRASRALLSLLVTILVFGVLLYAWGFPSHQSFLDALTFSAKSTTSLFRPPDAPLTTAGEWLNMALRLLGPLFFGLALLSLRGRVKR